jgi:hypothetical protein
MQHVALTLMEEDGCGAGYATDGYKNGKFNHARPCKIRGYATADHTS